MAVTTVFAGVANVLISDGKSTVLIDGYFSRPSLLRLATRVSPDHRRIRAALQRLGAERLDAVMVSHSHADHALDAPVVAQMTGATLYGSRSTRMIQEGYGLGAGPFRELSPGEVITLGGFRVKPIAAQHSDGDRVPGEIEQPLRAPAPMRAFKTGQCYSFLVEHDEGTVFIHPTANFIPGALAGLHADSLYLGAGGIGSKPGAWKDAYWAETVGYLQPSIVRPIHWDAFWKPIDKPLTPLPKRLDDFAATMESFCANAAPDLDLRLPHLWETEQVMAR